MPRGRRKATIVEEVKTGDVVGGVNDTSVVKESPITTEGETVVVCSNYPRDLKFMVPDSRGKYQPIVIKGNAVNLVGRDKGIIPIGAYGITTGVPKDAWDWVMKNRPDDEFLKRGLVFASTPANARKEAEERSNLRHGYEPINPSRAGNSAPVQR